MSVIGQLQITKTPFSGYDDPSLPSGTWHAQGIVVGDASGGTLEMDLVFSPSTAPFDSQYYSWDEVYVTDTQQASGPAKARIINMRETVDRAIAFTLIRNHNDSELHLEGRDYAFLPVFLGQQLNPATTSLLGFAVLNGLAEILTFTAGGYFWSVRSLNTPGGPSRPVQGLFSS